ncbi:MAG TPA: XRE family transcriptional regulator [Cyanobacteria bacterium UBA11149]|nr:XRE family transcriptional regulator [Cyanobacteria bacterium UBA11367]HBE61072.1 XRE family transcriptional regulator [Cyanobacteria bacterium UBA11366]HBK62264.1 XRE family transcriptional regulator [Cyanobacteria bacterium UBA11166]HBR74258.1 XRE family transcriptional regulator [Cyanobacteria bacterium UBA11159]HBS69847.1 XRE family transcriptional regulator [Cyanobacteria bacterium UBA11153]HBW87959.1 XRE family transcriptional regulator [Cyanobacteria bacterium UBA11149]HCA95009.1 XR
MAQYTFNKRKLARLVRIRRRDYGLREVANQIGISASTISRVERGESTLDMESFLKLCDWLCVRPSYFFKHPDSEKTKKLSVSQILEVITDESIDVELAMAIEIIIKKCQGQEVERLRENSNEENQQNS